MIQPYRSYFIALAAFVAPESASSQAANSDQREQIFPFEDGAWFDLSTSPDAIQLVMFQSGERILTMALSNEGAFQVSISPTRDSLVLRAAEKTSMSQLRVRTNAHIYNFVLKPQDENPQQSLPQLIRFTFEDQSELIPAPIAPPEPPDQSPAGIEWKLGGSKQLRPSRIVDDGQKIYLWWPQQRLLPAIFSVGPSGKEEIVDGYMRGEVYTIDALPSQLIFRIDKEKASARRILKRGK